MPRYRISVRQGKRTVYQGHEDLHDFGDALDRAADRAEENAEVEAGKSVFLDIEVVEEETRRREKWRMRYSR